MDQNTIYERFVSGCEQRIKRIKMILAKHARDPSAETLETVNLLIQDWVGESALLGFDKIGGVANKISEMITRWPVFDARTQGSQVIKWSTRLLEISRKAALSAPTSEVASMLGVLEAELDHELLAADLDRSPTSEHSSLVDTPGRRILLLDDSPIVGEALAVELESRGHQAALATDLAEFNQRLADFEPEMIFLDINMPEIRGDELCRKLRQRFNTRQVPIIFLSSLTNEELAELARNAGANGYLSKQAGMESLLRYLDKLLEEIVF